MEDDIIKNIDTYVEFSRYLGVTENERKMILFNKSQSIEEKILRNKTLIKIHHDGRYIINELYLKGINPSDLIRNPWDTFMEYADKLLLTMNLELIDGVMYNISSTVSIKCNDCEHITTKRRLDKIISNRKTCCDDRFVLTEELIKYLYGFYKVGDILEHNGIKWLLVEEIGVRCWISKVSCLRVYSCTNYTTIGRRVSCNGVEISTTSMRKKYFDNNGDPIKKKIDKALSAVEEELDIEFEEEVGFISTENVESTTFSEVEIIFED